MILDTVKTATGKLFESDYIATIPNPPQAYIRICGTPLPLLAEVFGNREETIQLWHGENYLAMYTKLVALVPEGDVVKVVLAKE